MAPLAVNIASGLAVASWMIYRYPGVVVPEAKVIDILPIIEVEYEADLPITFQYAGAIGGIVTALTASGLWYYQSMILYPASFPDGSRFGKAVVEAVFVFPFTH